MILTPMSWVSEPGSAMEVMAPPIACSRSEMKSHVTNMTVYSPGGIRDMWAP